MPDFRHATRDDIPAIARIYESIHTDEEKGLCVIGWKRGIYPTEKTAEAAVAAGDMFVAERDGVILASGRVNREQVPEYALAEWQYPAPDDRVMVLHTLTVDPARARGGIATAFVRFYEDYALSRDCPYLRIDTNARNTRARALYKKLGYTEVGIVPCVFNGIEGVSLVCLEKKLTGSRKT